MTDQYYFSIRQSQDYHNKAACPICGLEFRVRYLDVYNGNNKPICDLCAWEKAPALAGLLHLVETVRMHEGGEIPAHVGEALTQRQNDPARLKKELQGMLDSLNGHGSVTSPLTGLVLEQVKAALKSKKVKTMQQAKRLHGECRNQLVVIDDEIPF